MSYFTFNGHVYQYVETAGITWEQARAGAQSLYYGGVQGDLATVTTLAERTFIDEVIFEDVKPDNVFVGGSDALEEGVWRWVTGPEGEMDGGQGQIFYANGVNYTDIPSSDLWIGGAQPSQDGPSYDYLYMYSWWDPSFNPWNNSTGSPGAGGNGGYLVEYNINNQSANLPAEFSYTNSLARFDVTAGKDDLYDLSMLEDGSIIAVGSAGGSPGDWVVLSVNPDGTLNPEFNSGEVFQFEVYGNDGGFAITTQDDGKVVLGGTINNGSNNDFALVRLNADGSFDTSFSDDGKLIKNVQGTYDCLENVGVQADGKILATGYVYEGGNSSPKSFAVLRYNTDGTLDTTFGSSGLVKTAVTSGQDYGFGFAQQDDGKFLLAGVANGGSHFAIVRYLEDGGLDQTFGSGGMILTDITSPQGSPAPSRNWGRALLVQDDGKIVFSGSKPGEDGLEFVTYRFGPDGAPDTGFGVNGVVVHDVSDGNDYATGVVQQADGKLVVGGYGDDAGDTTDTAILLTRYLTDGQLDLTFGVDGVTRFDPTDSWDIALDMALSNDGRIVMVGSVTNDPLTGYSSRDSDLAIFQFTGDGRVLGPGNYVENGSPVLLDTSIYVKDLELSSAGSYAGASISISRQGGAVAEDVFSAGAAGLGALVEGGDLVWDGVVIGEVVKNSGGEVRLTFTAASTEGSVNQVLRSIQYENTADDPPATVTIDWTFNDGNSGDQGAGGSAQVTASATVNITAVEDPPVPEVYEYNGHYYQVINEAVTWQEAMDLAAGSTYEGVEGHLVTVTSAGEQAFVTNLVKEHVTTGWDGSSIWLAASDAQEEGVWRWMAGPESGSNFWAGDGSGGPVAESFSAWINDYVVDEDAASGGSGTWTNPEGTGADYVFLDAIYSVDSNWDDAYSSTTASSSLTSPVASGDGLRNAYVVEYSVASVNDAPTLYKKTVEQLDLGQNESLFASAVQSDGKILVGGRGGDDSIIARYNADLSVDESFAAGGEFRIDLSSGFEAVRSIHVLEDGRIVASNGVDRVFRLSDSGGLDTGFGVNGYGTTVDWL
jgi:uncharacterized delta-60 repeat protein